MIVADFKIKADKRAEWELGLKNNQDPYGAAVYRYAARWAQLMDRLIADGVPLARCAKQASHDADVEGISGFMYGCAVSILSQVWEHGDAMRRWHNVDTQLGNEGDIANEEGGVLNPALLCVR